MARVGPQRHKKKITYVTVPTSIKSVRIQIEALIGKTYEIMYYVNLGKKYKRRYEGQ